MFPTRFSLAEILILAGPAGACGMAPPSSTRISARLNVFKNSREFMNEMLI